MAILALCELYGATFEDFEKILKLDALLYKGPQGFESEEKAGLERVAKRAEKGLIKTGPKIMKTPRKRKR